MAVVFISPKQRQKMFFIGITAIFLLLLIIVSLVVLLSKPKEVLPEFAFNKPKVDINMGVFDSDQFKALQPFAEMKMQYSYKALNASNKVQTGLVLAVSIDEAKTILEDEGLTVTELKEVDVGRDNPFTPYYQTTGTQTTGQ